MIPKLNKELSDALNQDDPLEVVDPVTGRHYVIVERSVFDISHRKSVRDAIQNGIESMENGRGTPLAEADERMRQRLGFPPRK